MIGVKGLKEIWFSVRGRFPKSIEFEVRKTLKQTIKDSKGTRLYKNRTGLLRKSSIIKSIGREGDYVVGTLLNKAPYSAFIHNGTKKIHPRPFLSESLAPQIPQLMENLGDATVKALIHSRHRN
jgi:hypothetical protein